MSAHTENRWEEFARQDAEAHILTGQHSGFFESGQLKAEEILHQVDGLLPGHRLAIEFGCGVGRLALPMARHFERVIGVDVSPTMLAKLAENCRHLPAANITGVLAGDPWGSEADLVYSNWVFQHIEDSDVIAGCVQRLASVLRTGGIAHLQFDTRPLHALYRLRNRLPDSLLPVRMKRGLRRIRRSRNLLLNLFHDCRLELLMEHAPGTAEHVFILRKG